MEVEDDGLDEDAPHVVSIHVTNLPGVQGASRKRHRVCGDMCSILDYFVELKTCIEKMKMET